MNAIDLARIDLNLLVTFEALMGLRSVGLAADRLGRTPSVMLWRGCACSLTIP